MADSRHILVVDDQQDILDLTQMVLHGAGYRVTTAHSGERAIERLLDDPFDLVLLDINMPQMDGWETLRIIRADDSNRRLPVMMFSVKGQLHDHMQSLQEGATGYINKPFVVDDLLGSVARALDDAVAG